MNRRTFLTALGASFLTVASGCVSDADEEDIMSELTDVERLKEDGLSGPSVTRFIDREAGVVIYQSVEGNGSGVTAVPISETNLR